MYFYAYDYISPYLFTYIYVHIDIHCFPYVFSIYTYIQIIKKVCTYPHTHCVRKYVLGQQYHGSTLQATLPLCRLQVLQLMAKQTMLDKLEIKQQRCSDRTRRRWSAFRQLPAQESPSQPRDTTPTVN